MLHSANYKSNFSFFGGEILETFYLLLYCLESRIYTRLAQECFGIPVKNQGSVFSWQCGRGTHRHVRLQSSRRSSGDGPWWLMCSTCEVTDLSEGGLRVRGEREHRLGLPGSGPSLCTLGGRKVTYPLLPPGSLPVKRIIVENVCEEMYRTVSGVVLGAQYPSANDLSTLKWTPPDSDTQTHTNAT